MAFSNRFDSHAKTAVTMPSESSLKESSAVSDDAVSEVTLANNNAKWQVRGMLVAFGGFLGWILVAMLGSAMIESNPLAVGLFRSTGVERLHSQCAFAWTMLTGLSGEYHAPTYRRTALHLLTFWSSFVNVGVRNRHGKYNFRN
jgi:hypothetical protein